MAKRAGRVRSLDGRRVLQQYESGRFGDQCQRCRRSIDTGELMTRAAPVADTHLVWLCAECQPTRPDYGAAFEAAVRALGQVAPDLYEAAVVAARAQRREY